MTNSLLDTTFVIFFNLIAVLSMVFYSSDKAEKYYLGKTEKIQSVKGSSIIIKICLYLSFLVNNVEYFFPFQGKLIIWNIPEIKILGMIIGGIGILVFIFAKLKLGKQYSPCFNSYVPKELVQESIYKYIRHPIYLANLLIYFGFFISSGSLIIGASFAVMFLLYTKAIEIEENALKKNFSDFDLYVQRTGKFFPKMTIIDFAKKKQLRESLEQQNLN